MKSKISIVVSSVIISVIALSGCGSKKVDSNQSLKIYMPDGAPAVAMAEMMNENEKEFEFNVVDAKTINTYVTGAEPKADMCILPFNMATKLLGKGDKYKMMGTVTHGNLYLLSLNGEKQYTVDNLNELKGKTIGVIQINNVPGIIWKIILNQNNIPYEIIGNDGKVSEDKVNLKAITPQEISPAIKLDVYIAPEPAASLKVNNTPLKYVGNLQELYGGENGYPQAVIVVKNTIADKNKETVKKVADKLKNTNKWLKSASVKEIVTSIDKNRIEGLMPALNEKNLTNKTIENLGIRFEYSMDYKVETNKLIEKMLSVAPESATQVLDEFYYVF